MRKGISIGLLLLTELAFLRLWFVCKELRDFFYFSMQNIQLIIIDQIHNDVGIPLLLVRIFHNKGTVTVIELIRHYLYFWDIRFLLPFISPIGVFAVFAGFWYLLRSKMPAIQKTFFLIILLSIPLVEMILKPQLPFSARLILLSVPYVLLSVIGVWHFLSPKQPIRYGIFFVLLVLSLWWYFVFQNELLNFCVKIS